MPHIPKFAFHCCWCGKPMYGDVWIFADDDSHWYHRTCLRAFKKILKKAKNETNSQTIIKKNL